MEIQKARRRCEQKIKLREIEVMIISASNLKNVKHLHKMKPYAEVYVDKDVHVARTHVDDHGGADPTWNEVVQVQFPQRVPESDIKTALNVDIYAQGNLRDNLIGRASLLLCDVLKDGDSSESMDNPMECTTVRVWRESGSNSFTEQHVRSPPPPQTVPQHDPQIHLQQVSGDQRERQDHQRQDRHFFLQLEMKATSRGSGYGCLPPIYLRSSFQSGPLN